MKKAAMIALIMGGISIMLGMSQYFQLLLQQNGGGLGSLTNIVMWPLRILLGGLPVVILSIGILMKPDENRGSQFEE